MWSRIHLKTRNWVVCCGERSGIVGTVLSCRHCGAEQVSRRGGLWATNKEAIRAFGTLRGGPNTCLTVLITLLGPLSRATVSSLRPCLLYLFFVGGTKKPGKKRKGSFGSSGFELNKFEVQSSEDLGQYPLVTLAYQQPPKKKRYRN